MREWVEQTVERIVALEPRRVLEIGCGSGLLLFRVAPWCTVYHGTDVSAEALRAIEVQLRAAPLPQVTLEERAADDFRGLAAESFDLVVLNSVVQYFPHVDYLLDVLHGALPLVRPGGALFVGDVRSLPLADAYHTSVELYRAPADMSIEELRQRVHKRMLEEEELALDPAFFTAFAESASPVTCARAQPKHGLHPNEMTRYRYDVTLEVGRPKPDGSRIAWLDWQQASLGRDAFRRILAGKPDVIGIRRVPNAHLCEDVGAVELTSYGTGLRSVADLRRALASRRVDAMSPAEARALSAELGYGADLRCAGRGSDACYHLLLYRDAQPPSVMWPDERVPRQAWTHYANDPLIGRYSC